MFQSNIYEIYTKVTFTSPDDDDGPFSLASVAVRKLSSKPAASEEVSRPVRTRAVSNVIFNGSHGVRWPLSLPLDEHVWGGDACGCWENHAR